MALNVYAPYRELEVPLNYWHLQAWLNGALPDIYLPVRMGPLSLPGDTWPVLAGYAPHPLATTTAGLANLRLLYTALITVSRAVIQFVTRILTISMPKDFYLTLQIAVPKDRYSQQSMKGASAPPL